MNLLCLLGFHSYKPESVHHYRDVSFISNPREDDGAPSTSVIYRCPRCWKWKKESHYGIGFKELSFFVKPTPDLKEKGDKE